MAAMMLKIGNRENTKTWCLLCVTAAAVWIFFTTLSSTKKFTARSCEACSFLLIFAVTTAALPWAVETCSCYRHVERSLFCLLDFCCHDCLAPWSVKNISRHSHMECSIFYLLDFCCHRCHTANHTVCVESRLWETAKVHAHSSHPLLPMMFFPCQRLEAKLVGLTFTAVGSFCGFTQVRLPILPARDLIRCEKKQRNKTHAF